MKANSMTRGTNDHMFRIAAGQELTKTLTKLEKDLLISSLAVPKTYFDDFLLDEYIKEQGDSK